MPQPSAQRHHFTVGPGDGGRRLDQLLAARVAGLSRRQARVLLDLGGVFVDGARFKMAGRQLKPGQEVDVWVGGALARASGQTGAAARARDEAALEPPRIIHRDDDLVVIEKPASLLSAATPESDRNTAPALLEQQLGAPVWVVHRLDLGTSGLLVYARTGDANRALAETFRTHALTREYLAVLDGAVAAEAVTVTVPVAGKRAVTHLSVLARIGERATLVRCRLETGRTHQIRLHGRAIGHPVLGDRRYGTPTDRDPPRLALHAARLAFPHPRSGELLDFTSPWPADLTPWLEALQRRAADDR